MSIDCCANGKVSLLGRFDIPIWLLISLSTSGLVLVAASLGRQFTAHGVAPAPFVESLAYSDGQFYASIAETGSAANAPPFEKWQSAGHAPNR